MSPSLCDSRIPGKPGGRRVDVGSVRRLYYRTSFNNGSAMETVGLGFCFEDLPLGRQFQTIGRTVTEPDIVNFINAIGMTEVLFTNLDFLKNEAGFKGRLAPGSLVYCFAEGLLAQSTMQGTGFAFLGMQ